MTQPRSILWYAILIAPLLLLPLRASAQSGTLTDDAFVSANSGIHTLRTGLAASEANDLSMHWEGSAALVRTWVPSKRVHHWSPSTPSSKTES